jgi:hypothetical protein
MKKFILIFGMFLLVIVFATLIYASLCEEPMCDCDAAPSGYYLSSWSCTCSGSYQESTCTYTPI